MCHFPCVLTVVSREQSVVYCRSQLEQRPTNFLSKAFLIAYLVEQFMARDDDEISGR